MFKIELLKGYWYCQSFGKEEFEAVKRMEHLRDLKFLSNCVVLIPRESVRIGRSRKNDVIIEDSYLQQGTHCSLDYLGCFDKIYLRNLGARNPIIVIMGMESYTNNSLQNETEIKVEDVLRFGEVELKLLEIH